MSSYDFLSLKLFVAVCDLRNIAHAAKANNIAASAVSKRIAELEVQTNSVLLYRLRDGVHPTTTGEAVYRHAALVLGGLEQLDFELSEFSNGKKGFVSIWANSSSVAQFLPNDISNFLKLFPSIQVNIREEKSIPNISAIINGKVDFAIFSGNSVYKNLDTRIYKHDKLLLITPLNHPLSNYNKIKFVDTIDYDYIALNEDSSLQSRIHQEAINNGCKLKISVRVSGFDSMRNMVESGMGIAILPQSAVDPYLGSSNLKTVLLDEIWSERSLLIGFRSFETLSMSAKNLVDFLAPARVQN